MHRLYVFSATGNTLYAAERVAQALGETETINIATLPEGPVRATGETVGIAFPVHAFGAPGLVKRFLQRFETPEPTWVYALFTSAGGPMGTGRQMERLLAARGIPLAASFHVTMPTNYPPVSNPPAGEKLDAILRTADTRIDEVARAVVARKRGFEPTNCVTRLLTRLAAGHVEKKLGDSDKRFFVSSACTACGVCAKVCPVGDIELDADGRPTWKHECTSCFACFNWCPERAIQYSHRSKKKNRYTHPAVSLARILEWSGK